MFSERFSSSLRRNLRMASGLVLFTYIGAHLINHALGLISLDTAEAGMGIAVEVWYSLPGTILLYGAFATHFMMALFAVYERRTFRLPPLELLRIVLGFTMPILLIGHAASTRLAYEMFGLSSDYTRIVSNLWATGSQGWQLGLMAPGWLHGCLGLHFAFNRRWWYRQFRFVLFSAALLLPVLSALGFIAMGRELATSPAAAAAALQYLSPDNAVQRLAITQWKDNLLNWYFAIIAAAFIAREIRNLIERRRKRLVSISYPGRDGARAARLVGAGGEPELPSAARRHVRRPGALLDLPGAGDRRRGILPAGGQRRAGDIGADRRAAARASRLPAAPAGRHLGRAVGADRAAGLPADGAARWRARGGGAVLRLPQPGGAVGRSLAAGFAVFADALCRERRQRHPRLRRHAELCGVRQHLRAVRPRGRRQCGARRAAAAGAIEGVMADLNRRLGKNHDDRVKTAVTMHQGRAAVGEIGSSDPPVLMAVGEVVDVANDLRKAAAEHDKAFAISEAVYAEAGVVPVDADSLRAGAGAGIKAYLTNSAPMPSPNWTLHGELGRGALLRRLWAGG